MHFVNKIAERNGNTQRTVWINLYQLQLNYVYNNSTYPSDFSIRTNSIKNFSSRITSISVPKSVKPCSVRSSANFTHAGITNRSLKARNPPSMRTHFAAVSENSNLCEFLEFLSTFRTHNLSLGNVLLTHCDPCLIL